MLLVCRGVDAGKSHHHCVVIDSDGTRLLSRKFANDEEEILDLLGDVVALAAGDAITWATDLNQGGAALMISVLATNGQTCSTSPVGAFIMLPVLTGVMARPMRRTQLSSPIKPECDGIFGRSQKVMLSAQISKVLTAYRTDLVHDRPRSINRLWQALLEYYPALEAAFGYSRSKGAQRLLTGYQTPDGLREIGSTQLTAWLRENGVYQPEKAAGLAIAAANKQQTTVRGEREEKNSIAIASNQSFGEWPLTFADPRLCGAIVDRLTFNATIIETGTESYRQNHGRQNAV